MRAWHRTVWICFGPAGLQNPAVQIPAHLVGELHVAGHQQPPISSMTMEAVSPGVRAVYRHAQQRFQGVPALVEWDTAIPPLQVLLDEAEGATRVVCQLNHDGPFHVG
jgi:uncharacterized protein (UPF0276 family)